MSTAQSNPGKWTCRSCNGLLVNESSRAIILDGEPPFHYIRKKQDLISTASSGCVLCQQLLDRHNELGPSDATDSNCPSECPWSVFSRDSSQLVFLVHSMKDERHRDGALRYLKVRGLRRAGRRHESRERAHIWELVYNVVTENGKIEYHA